MLFSVGVLMFSGFGGESATPHARFRLETLTNKSRRKVTLTCRFVTFRVIGLIFLRLQRRAQAVREADAPLAQSAERLHGKEKVNSSILLGGSVVSRRRSTES